MTATIADVRTDRTRLLRAALGFDALASGVLGAALTAGAGALDGALGPSRPQLLGVGVFLLVWAAALLLLAARAAPNRTGVWTVIGFNALWAVDSVVLAAGDWVPLTALGTAVLLGQAVAVAGFAVAQYAGLRRAT